MLVVAAVFTVVKDPKLLFLLVGGFGFLMLLVFARDWVILGIFALLPFSLEIDITSSTSITLPTEALIPATVGVVFVSTLITGRFRYIASPVNWAIVAYFGLATISILWSHAFVSTAKAIIREGGYVLSAFYLFQVYATNRRRLMIFLVATLVTHMLLTLYGFGTQAVGGIRIYDDIAMPFFENHCIYAAYLCVTFCFLISFAMTGTRGTWQLVCAMCTGIVGLAIALTFVRASWISLVVVLGYLIVRLRRRSVGVDLLVLLMAAMSILLLVLASTDVGELIWQRITTVGDTQYVSNHDRIDRWMAAYRMWIDHPVTGVGYGAYPDIYSEYVFFQEAYSTEIRMGAHNLYLEILAELGIPGLLVFLTLLIVFRNEATFVQNRTADPVIQACMLGAKAGMLSILAHSFFNNLGPSDKISLTLWLLFSIVLVCKRITYEVEPSRARETVSSDD